MNDVRRPEQFAAMPGLFRSRRLAGCAGMFLCCVQAACSQQNASPAAPLTAPQGTVAVTTPAAPGPPVLAALEEIAAPDQDDDGLLSFHGLAATQSATTLDGVSMTQSFLAVAAGRGADPAPDPDGDSDSAERTTGPANGLSRGRHAGAAYVFSQAAVREFRLVGGDYSAQTGGAGQVQTTVSRSGGAALHGVAGVTLRSQAFAATNPYSIQTSYANGVVSSALVKPHDLREAFVAS